MANKKEISEKRNLNTDWYSLEAYLNANPDKEPHSEEEWSALEIAFTPLCLRVEV